MGKPFTKPNKFAEQQKKTFAKNFDAHKHAEQDWNLEWFECTGRQNFIQEAMDDKLIIIVDAPSGCGKTTTVIHKALQMIRAKTKQKIVYVKNPAECGDDKIGFLPGDEEEKLAPHAKTTIGVFQQFVSKGRLDCMLNKQIEFAIPNFLQGSTIDNAVLILDESQNMSPSTVKLVAERAGENTIVVIIGDSKQRYSVVRREDGLRDIINKVTYEEIGVRLVRPSFEKNVGYVRMETNNNMRSELSKIITELYE